MLDGRIAAVGMFSNDAEMTACNVEAETMCPGSSAFCDGTSRYGVPENLTTG